jgi:hypothetical protein
MSDYLELVDYLSFFEAEPLILNPEVGWGCGAKFVSVRGAQRFVATIAPSDGVFSFQWWQEEKLRNDLTLKGVIHWALECDSQRELLRLKFHQPCLTLFTLQLKPEISVSLVTEWA